MKATRQPTASEIETLREVLVLSLSKACQQDMKDLAIECAKSIKAAFDELYGVSESSPEKCS
ncbi:hypothetical protein [Pseudomonas vancouverensis]|uniref:hypothetical protein n=1 Tax=Pseudomonas vancouverensis TaxID=95300 RepID=UPI00087C840E|nr:hypothetical protein [Pseudomonas vancouverensis]SDU96792.1 hypothetical protein SAMN05216558_1283 [Pseudomonas vancouverensis]